MYETLMKLWHYSILLICWTGIFAQSTSKISGRVCDASTNKPLAGAHVSVTGTGIGTVTDANGRFIIENLLQGTYDLSFSYMGYTTQERDGVRVASVPSADMVVRLHPATVMLPGVTVTAIAADEYTLPGVLVVSQKDIRSGKAPTLPDLLKTIPGIAIDPDSHTGSSRISIRGSQANQVLVLVDGVPLNNHRDGTADLSLVPLELIDTIIIKKGGGSARLGSGAIGGVIEIRTIEPDRTRIQTRIQSGSFGSLRLSPRLSVRTGDLTFFAALTHHVDRNHYPFTYDAPGDTLLREIRRNADLSLTNWFVKSGFRHGRHEAILQGSMEYSDRGLPGQVFTWTPAARVVTARRRVRARYQIGLPGSHATFSLNAGVSTIHNTNSYTPDTQLKDRRYPEYNYRDRVRYLRTETAFSGSPASWLSGRAAWELNTTTFSDRDLRENASPVSAARDRSQSLSLMQTATLRLPALAARVVLIPSLRYDDMTSHAQGRHRYEAMVSPGIGGRFNWQGPLQLYAGFDRSGNFRAPTFADLFYQDARIQGSPDLLPEKSVHTEASLGLVCDLFGSMRLEYTAFQDRITDMISWRLGSFEVFRPYNTDALITGSEWMAEIELLSGALHTQVAFTRLDPRSRSGDRITDNAFLPYKPLSSLKSSISWSTGFADASCTYRFTGKRALNEANTSWGDPFTIMDLTLSRALVFPDFSLELSLTIHNIFDVRYEIIDRMVQPGRRLFFGIDITPTLNNR